MEPVRAGPEELEPQPVREIRNMLEGPDVARRDGAVIVRVVHRPVRRALEDPQMRDFRGDGRGGLYGAGARADHRDAFAFEIDALVPPRRVEHRPFEIVETADL